MDSASHWPLLMQLLESDSPALGRIYCNSPEELRGRSKVRQQERARRAISEVSLKPGVN